MTQPIPDMVAELESLLAKATKAAEASRSATAPDVQEGLVYRYRLVLGDLHRSLERCLPSLLAALKAKDEALARVDLDLCRITEAIMQPPAFRTSAFEMIDDAKRRVVQSLTSNDQE